MLLTLHMILVMRFLSPECYVLAMRDISDVALLLVLALLLSAMGLAGMLYAPETPVASTGGYKSAWHRVLLARHCWSWAWC